MKIPIFLFLMALAENCNDTNSGEAALYGPTWELEYITGARIAFQGLYPNNKPRLSFDQETKRVTGTDSCNGYSADFVVEGNTLSFGEPGPTTMMFCGGSERQFLEMMKKVDGFALTDGKLNLLMGELPVMRFKKIGE